MKKEIANTLFPVLGTVATIGLSRIGSVWALSLLTPLAPATISVAASTVAIITAINLAKQAIVAKAALEKEVLDTD